MKIKYPPSKYTFSFDKNFLFLITLKFTPTNLAEALKIKKNIKFIDNNVDNKVILIS